MSISGSLANAFSGLTAAARGAEVISQNLANATTEGYGRRELRLSAAALGGVGAGVRVDGVARTVNLTLLQDRRLADAAEARDGTLRESLARMEAALGTPGTPGALTTRFEVLESALVAAESRPDSGSRLEALLGAATALAAGFRSVTDTIQGERMRADGAIAAEVGQLNEAMRRIAEINIDIRTEVTSGRDPSALLDARQKLVDAVSAIVPVREVPREHGQIALYTEGGAVLLDGSRAGEVTFTPTPTITADMTLASGGLSGLTFRGLPAPVGAASGLLGGGRLGALFAVRDEVAPAAQARLDALARDLVERFESAAADPTLAPGAAGLFTDGGAPFSAADETGLAGRLAVNALADPARGGALWRLRDGLGAMAPGPAGQAAGLGALAAALREARIPATGGFAGGAAGAAALAAEVLSRIGTERQAADGALAYARARAETLRSAELAGGVDTDHELQALLVIEKAYAANARVVAAAGAMLDRLMEI